MNSRRYSLRAEVSKFKKYGEAIDLLKDRGYFKADRNEHVYRRQPCGGYIGLTVVFRTARVEIRAGSRQYVMYLPEMEGILAEAHRVRSILVTLGHGVVFPVVPV